MVELIVVHSTRMTVELLHKSEAGVWPANPTMIEAAGVVELRSVSLTLPLAEIYTGTHLET